MVGESGNDEVQKSEARARVCQRDNSGGNVALGKKLKFNPLI